MDAKQLEGVGFFSGLSVGAGEKLATEGEFAHEFFVIAEGSADVTHDGRTIAELGPGDFFGEIGLLETERRTANVVATTAMRVIVMFGREFKQMEREMPSM